MEARFDPSLARFLLLISEARDLLQDGMRKLGWRGAGVASSHTQARQVVPQQIGLLAVQIQVARQAASAFTRCGPCGGV